ncbi:DNA (cytosine-5)-methyltransferase [Anopheles darlingi]|uniref:tRNA (cytosine(38)-C(5))-methyltransferase n=1 Tax=Anopheles darlingi TaxID=43151 RepID=W5J130_ANODA|nr:DNA (cytosine-5)-methyltransferase [Anopheles darlingi]
MVGVFFLGKKIRGFAFYDCCFVLFYFGHFLCTRCWGKMENSENSDPVKTLRVLELFSGIGGMRMALERTGRAFEIVSAIDVNPIANSVYTHNFGEKAARNGNILSLTAKTISKLAIDTVLMSPPCQPFTRNGKFNDIHDRRSDPFLHICELLHEIPTVEFILMENVKGFEGSQACALYKARLKEAGFEYQEYVLSPHQFGIPNTRHRYYCLAKRKGKGFKRKADGIIVTHPSNDGGTVPLLTIGDIVDPSENDEKYLLKEAALRKHLPIMDVCTPESNNSMCFTKAYTHYAEGTGSVFTPHSKEEFDKVYHSASIATDEPEKLALLRSLHVRYFTPQEVAKLMSFPKNFNFPETVTDKQRYRVLGNSINVHVVSYLLEELQ